MIKVQVNKKDENKTVAKVEIQGDIDTILNELAAVTVGILTDVGRKSGTAPTELFDIMSDGIQKNLIVQMLDDILGISKTTKN